MRMQNDLINTVNPWTEIPLDDYERHMSHASVEQLGLLNALTKKYLAKYKPATCIFMGIAGGNGLDHVDKAVTKHVIGIDINQAYLDVCFERYDDKIGTLQLLHLDITGKTGHICSANFIWAALLLEYTGIEKCFEFARNNISPGGHFIVTIQSNNKVQAVSPTGIESVKKAGLIFKAVNTGEMLAIANEMGFTLVYEEANELPNGKRLLTFDLKYK